MGEFDGSSAWQLIHLIRQRYNKHRRIFIHTAGLSSFHPFGRDVFIKESRNFKNLLNGLVFTGDYGNEFMLPGRSIA